MYIYIFLKAEIFTHFQNTCTCIIVYLFNFTSVELCSDKGKELAGWGGGGGLLMHSYHTLYQLFITQSRFLTTLGKTPFENIVGKGENAGNQHFLLFPRCFLPFPNRNSIHIYFVVCKCFQFGPV